MTTENRRMSARIFAAFAGSALILSTVALALVVPAGVQSVQAASEAICGPNDRPEPSYQGFVPDSDNTGFKGYSCAVDLVGSNTMSNRGGNGQIAEVIGNCLYYGTRSGSGPNSGVAVMDVSDPTNPTVLKTLKTTGFSNPYGGLHLRNGLLVGASRAGSAMDVYDVSGDCREPRYLTTFVNPAFGDNHDAWLTDDAKTWYTIPWRSAPITAGPSSPDLVITGLDDPSHPNTIMTWSRLALPADALLRTFAAPSFHDVTTNFDGTRLYMALYNLIGPGVSCANGLLTLDSTDIALRRPNPQLRYISFVSTCDDPTDPGWPGNLASFHTSEWFIGSDGKEYVVGNGESVGGVGTTCGQGGVRIYDMSDEANPKRVSSIVLEASRPENCALTSATGTFGYLHYLGFDDRANASLLFYSAYESGTRIFDIRDVAHPREIAYFNAPALTANGGVGPTQPDVIYDKARCLIYTSWLNQGLHILQLRDPQYCRADRTPPVITGLVASPATLWGPNHALAPVTVTATVTDDRDPAPQVRIVSVSSSEPESGLWDGDTGPDWVITGPLSVQLRAERWGEGPGRTYTITVEARDASGNASTGTTTVFVPHNMGK